MNFLEILVHSNLIYIFLGWILQMTDLIKAPGKGFEPLRAEAQPLPCI